MVRENAQLEKNKLKKEQRTMKKSAEHVLLMMIRLLCKALEELKGYKDEKRTQFQYGERTAYTECLEWIQQWEHAEKYGLDFDIEDKYPL